MAFIYVITNDINSKQYVGKTNDTIGVRFEQHIKDSKRRRCKKRPLYSAMNKYGVEHFSIEKLEECSPEEAPVREAYWIDKLNTYHYGYNATHGGDGKQLYNYNEVANKYLELKSQKETANIFHCDTKTIRQACKICGVDIIPSTIVLRKEYGKKVAQYDKDNHNKVINIFDSLMSAATYMIENSLTNCKHSTIRVHISEVCKGKRKSAGGFYWRFIE